MNIELSSCFFREKAFKRRATFSSCSRNCFLFAIEIFLQRSRLSFISSQLYCQIRLVALPSIASRVCEQLFQILRVRSQRFIGAHAVNYTPFGSRQRLRLSAWKLVFFMFASASLYYLGAFAHAEGPDDGLGNCFSIPLHQLCASQSALDDICLCIYDFYVPPR